MRPAVVSATLPPPATTSATAALNWLSTAAMISGTVSSADAFAASTSSPLSSTSAPR